LQAYARKPTKTVQGTVTAIASVREKASGAMAETETTAQNIGNRVDNARVEILHLHSSLNARIVNDPICGLDALSNLGTRALFFTRAVDRLFDDYIRHLKQGPGACFCVPDKWGNGKSTMVNVVA
jgi:hypothetical protein